MKARVPTQKLISFAEMQKSWMFTAHFSHVHFVGQKTVRNSFSQSDELLLTGVKKLGKKRDHGPF